MSREHGRCCRRAKEEDAFDELKAKAAEEKSGTGSEQANGNGADHNRDKIAGNDAKNTFAEKIEKLRISEPALNDQVPAEHKETINAQDSEGDWGARQTVEKLARSIALSDLGCV